MKKIIEWIKRMFNNPCPKCGGEMEEVYGWPKEQCVKCKFTRNV